MLDLARAIEAGDYPADLFGWRPEARRRPAWRRLPATGSFRARKVPLPVPPPPKLGQPRQIIVVDSFAGGGGASNGIEAALRDLDARGVLPAGHRTTVHYAVNHDPAALAMHMANHPATIHLPHNVWQVSMPQLLGDHFFGLLWLSPDCRDHSSAKGGPITSRGVRDLAWVLLKWLQELPDWQLPWNIYLENVPAFAKWSPLIQQPDGTFKRDKSREGETFYYFVRAIARLGFSVAWQEVTACEFGDPTIRKRLKMVMRRDGQPAVWPEPTHGEPKSEAVRSGKLQPWPVAAEIVDFHLPAPSILMTKAEAKAYTKATGQKIKRPLEVKSERRLAIGVKRYVIDAGDDAYVVTLNHGGDEFRGWPLDRPAPTIAASRDAHGLVVPHVVVYRGDSPGKPVTQPVPTPTANSFIKRPGGAVPLGVGETTLVPVISRGQHGGGNRPADEPFHTVAASDGDTNQVVTADLVPFLVPRYGERAGQEPRTLDIRRPAPTTVPDGNGGSLAAVYLAQYNTDMVGHAMDEAVSTIVQKGCTQAVVSAALVEMYGRSDARPVDVPASAVTTKSPQAVIAAHLTQFCGSNETAGGGDLREPVAAVRTGGGKGGGHTGVVTVPLVTAYYSNGGQTAGIDQPMLAVPTKARFGLAQADAAPEPLTEAQWASARRVADFLRKYGCWDEREIVTVAIRGAVFVLVDIGMRMFTPRELARAQGFPDNYVLAAPFKGRVLNDTEQRHKIGNSVCARPAAAIIAANYRPPMDWGQVAYLEAAE